MIGKVVATDVALQGRTRAKERVLVIARPSEDFPLEVVMLLDVLSRIEARRQMRLHGVRKEAS